MPQGYCTYFIQGEPLDQATDLNLFSFVHEHNDKMTDDVSSCFSCDLLLGKYQNNFDLRNLQILGFKVVRNKKMEIFFIV